MENHGHQASEVLNNQVRDLNDIIEFLAKRDIKSLAQQELEKIYGFRKANMLILLGNSLLCSAEVTAQAFKDGVAENLMIVGGIGHSTDYLVNSIRKHPLYRGIDTEDKAEADMLNDVLVKYLGIDRGKILIENQSTNCGSNAKEALKTARHLSQAPKSVILIQDPTMQLRTHASFLQEWKDEQNVIFINYSPLVPLLKTENQSIAFSDNNPEGLWDMERLLSLIMGEIPRLKDDAYGYGPKGKGFIAHVDIPSHVFSAYERLLPVFDTFLKNRIIKKS